MGWDICKLDVILIWMLIIERQKRQIGDCDLHDLRRMVVIDENLIWETRGKISQAYIGPS